MAGYFLYHSIGNYPGKAAETQAALAAFVTDWSRLDGDQWPKALAARDRFIRAWEDLIGAERGSMTTTENVTVALAAIIGGLQPDQLRGKRILIAEDCFPSLHFLLTGMAGARGFRLETVGKRDGADYVEDEDFIAKIGPDVALVLVTWITSTASKRADLAAIRAAARQTGTLVAIDITQGVGLLDFQVADSDIVVGSSLKWLCGYSGAGALYVRPSLIQMVKPELRGWFSQPNPFNWALDGFDYAADCRRFDHGTPAVLAAVASQPGIDFVRATGVEALRAHNLRLGDMLIAATRDLGLRLVSPPEPSRRGGSVMVKSDSADSAAAIVATLRRKDIHADHRGAVIRLSPGISTSTADVETLIAILAALR